MQQRVILDMQNNTLIFQLIEPLARIFEEIQFLIAPYRWKLKNKSTQNICTFFQPSKMDEEVTTL